MVDTLTGLAFFRNSCCAPIIPLGEISLTSTRASDLLRSATS